MCDIKSVLSAIRLDRLHSTYVLQSLQPHVMQYGVAHSDWHDICALAHDARRSTDETIGGRIVSVSAPPKKIAKDLWALKDGTYTLTAACTCSYMCSTGPVESLTIVVTVNARAAPPVRVKSSQCDYCNRVVLHLFCQQSPPSETFPSLNCGNISRIRAVLKSSQQLAVLLSEAENRSISVRRGGWYLTPLPTLLRTLSNDNTKSLTEYELLEAALDWLDYRLPDKSYLVSVITDIIMLLFRSYYHMFILVTWCVKI